MEKRYRLVFVYPDRHIEEVDAWFNNGREALDYGNNLLGQVYNTEKFHGTRSSGFDDFFEKKPIDPYFMIVEVCNKKRRMVYDSRNK